MLDLLLSLLLSSLPWESPELLALPGLPSLPFPPANHFFSFSLYAKVSSSQKSRMCDSVFTNCFFFFLSVSWSSSSESSCSEAEAEESEPEPYPESIVFSWGLAVARVLALPITASAHSSISSAVTSSSSPVISRRMLIVISASNSSLDFTTSISWGGACSSFVEELLPFLFPWISFLTLFALFAPSSASSLSPSSSSNLELAGSLAALLLATSSAASCLSSRFFSSVRFFLSSSCSFLSLSVSIFSRPALIHPGSFFFCVSLSPENPAMPSGMPPVPGRVGGP